MNISGIATLLAQQVSGDNIGNSADAVGTPGFFENPLVWTLGILLIGSFGVTINMMVLFALIMAVGMLVDGAIVVTEMADRRMAEGDSRHDSYARAAIRMAWPIIASTCTTLDADCSRPRITGSTRSPES